MPLRGVAFLGFYFFCLCGAFVAPHLGIYGYITTYCIGPENEWWSVPFRHWGIRFSYFIAVSTAIGFFLNRAKLDWGKELFLRQEILFWIFVGLIWFSRIISEPTIGRYTTVDHPSIKLLKIGIFLFLLTHTITDLKKINQLFWILTLSTFFLGIEAWETPWSAFQSGRLERIGGADFAEANFFGAFMGAMLPIIGVQFLRSDWKGKIITLLAGAFTANAVILCRSRGAFLGILFGIMAALLYAPKKHRKKIYIVMLIGIIGGIRLADPQFVHRISSIVRPVEGQTIDESAASRPRLWKAGFHMLLDHPLGIGAGNWYQTIGHYIPEYEGKDSHSTFVKAFAELGIQGGVVFLLLIASAYHNLFSVQKVIKDFKGQAVEDMVQFSFGITVALTIFIASSITITTIYTEALWIIMMLPVCLLRAVQNEPSSS